MDQPNQSALDYYLLPRIDMTAPRLRLAKTMGFRSTPIGSTPLTPFLVWRREPNFWRLHENGTVRSRTIDLIPIERITVINPRVRNKKIFKEIIANIAEFGLKRPITVTRRDDADGPRYDLVCGQGRLEAYQALGQREIPALVVEADTEDCLVMSLVENLARRQHRAIDLLHDIEGLKRRGYSDTAIARKTDLTIEYVKGVIRLLQNGEHRLLRAVEAGQIPVSIAVDIAAARRDTDHPATSLREKAFARP